MAKKRLDSTDSQIEQIQAAAQTEITLPDGLEFTNEEEKEIFHQICFSAFTAKTIRAVDIFMVLRVTRLEVKIREAEEIMMKDGPLIEKEGRGGKIIISTNPAISALESLLRLQLSIIRSAGFWFKAILELLERKQKERMRFERK